MFSQSQQLSLNFYEWEYLRGRGYLHFPFQVDIEPPFEFFEHKYRNERTEKIDDGRVPSLLQKVVGLFKTAEPVQEDEVQLIPRNDYSKEGISTLRISNFTAIGSPQYVEFLNLLALNIQTYSFELVGNAQELDIQFTCPDSKIEQLRGLIKAYFPNLKIEEISPSFDLNSENAIAICDFGYSEEFMRPLNKLENGSDPFQHLFTVFEQVQAHEKLIIQILFKGTTRPWAESIRRSVRTHSNQAFFADSPEMLILSDQKTKDLIFAVVFRMAIQSPNEYRIQSLAKETISHISYASNSGNNQLIPLSNEGYRFEDHVNNLVLRKSNRLGMLWSTSELSNFVHFPSDKIQSKYFQKKCVESKEIAEGYTKGKYLLGNNIHEDKENPVYLSQEDKNKHIHIIGVTGVGKSTLLSQMILDDINLGNGVAVFDPHGDLIERNILPRIPLKRKNDVIVFDPSITKTIVGFNILEAHNDFEKIVLSSDLVEAFKSTATSWGDNMSAVLANAINTFLESNKGGSIVELKRFLVDDGFRKNFLSSVHDPNLQTYWNHEYPKIQKGITPLLTRIDGFLRNKIIRNILSIKNGLDVEAAMNSKKIILVKLPQGLIGFENANLLGSLLLSKLHQATFARQQRNDIERNPFTIYLDEFQNFLTPSMTSMLEGSRKYQVSLVLAHQHLKQIKDAHILDSVLSNAYTRIAFRLGDEDARKLASGFSLFKEEVLGNLSTGEAIARIGMSKQDFNLSVSKLDSQINEELAEEIKQQTLLKYGTNIGDIKYEIPVTTIKEEPVEVVVDKPIEQPEAPPLNVKIEEIKKSELREAAEKSDRNREHQYLQKLIKKMGQERDFLSTIEKEVQDGGRVDVALEKQGTKIAVEISVTNTPDYEVQNIRKCLRSGYLPVVIVSKNESHLRAIQSLAQKELSAKDFSFVRFTHPDAIAQILDSIAVPVSPHVELIKGFRVNTEYDSDLSHNPTLVKESLAKILFGKN
jgi:Type IV secretion-system coupling protein DNA-binding domain